MCKIEVAGSKKRLSEVLEKIQEVGVVHVDEVPLLSPRPDDFELHRIPLTEEQEERRIQLERASDNFNEVCRMLDPTLSQKLELEFEATGNQPTCTLPLDQVVEKSKDILHQASQFEHRRTVLVEEQQVLENYQQVLKTLLPLIQQSPQVKDYHTVGITLAGEEVEAVALLEEELNKLTDEQAQLFKGEGGDKSTVALVAFPQKYEKKVKDLIWDQGISEIKLPSGFEDKAIDESAKALDERLRTLPSKIEKLQLEMEDYYEEHGFELVNLRHWSFSQVKRFKIIEKLAQSHYLFVLAGWLPEKQLASFQKEIQAQFGDDVAVNRLKPGRRDYKKVPVHLENKKMLKPFELLMQLFPPPTYGTLDVTALIGIVFPIFFGFILGDVFYGLLMAGGCFLLKKKMGQNPMVAQALKIYYACTFWTITFGILFGEFLGDVGHHYFGMKIFLYNREVDILFSMIVAIVIGVVHILLGLTLAVFLSHRVGDRHGFWAHLAFLITILDVLIVIGALMGVLPATLMKPCLWALAGLIPAIVYLEGAMAPIELISTIGNMLSYARLMALGLASVIMAVIANKFVTIFGNVVLGLIMATLLHTLNFALGVFAPTIQSLRLHYVEFFSKFYKPEGRVYEPFSMKEQL